MLKLWASQLSLPLQGIEQTQISLLHARTMHPNSLCHFKESVKHKFHCYMLELWAQIVSDTSRNRTNTKFQLLHAWTRPSQLSWDYSQGIAQTISFAATCSNYGPQLSLPLQGIEQTQISLLHARTMHTNSLCHFKESKSNTNFTATCSNYGPK